MNKTAKQNTYENIVKRWYEEIKIKTFQRNSGYQILCGAKQNNRTTCTIRVE